MIKVLISQQNNVFTWWVCRHDLRISGELGYIEVYVQEWVEQPGMEPTVDRDKVRPLRVDNTTRLPCELPDGTPLMHTVRRQALDEADNPMFWQVTLENGQTYTDRGQPIMEDVLVQRTIGEMDAVLWHLASADNPVKVPADVIIAQGMMRRANERLGLSLPVMPMKFVVTPYFTAAFGENW